VSDPRDVAKPGDIVKVRVVEVDEPRKRISLTMRLDDEPAKGNAKSTPNDGKRDSGGRGGGDGRRKRDNRGGQRGGKPSAPQGAMAEALRRAGLA
ncbi:MAG TPA: S1 RNA-binding domain-containing protein, partial [Stackebrandtia sp.]|uniref:S1 RNA-binding domain-containing protein n=1 Tax=Stackebrandtia sp. TaxID=2023065 RepID=UPI002D5A4212